MVSILASAAIAPLNHLLRGSGWALRRLQPCAGKTARIRIPPVADLTLAVQPGGEIAVALHGAQEDAILTVMPGLLPRLLVRDEAAYDEIRISGDSAFGREILHIGKNLHWDAEQDLSGLIGDIAAHRVTQTGNGLVRWHMETARNLSRTLKEYLTEEQPMLARAADIQAFTQDVDTVHDQADGLERRIDALMNRLR